MADDFSSKYNSVVARLPMQNFFNIIRKILAGLEIESGLEVGCGPGFSTKHLAKFLQGARFEASDISERLVQEAQQRNPGIKVSQESIYNLKRENKSFDLVIALEVLEHLEQPAAALKELQRVTSKYCLVSVPNEPLWRILNMCRLAYLKDFGNTPGHIQHWSKNQFKEIASHYFNIQEIKTPLPWTVILGKG